MSQFNLFFNVVISSLAFRKFNYVFYQESCSSMTLPSLHYEGNQGSNSLSSLVVTI